jgi:phosphorylase kinase alpha/beta subunit
MAQLTLVWPLGLQGEGTVAHVEKELLREKGVIRYLGDAYHAGATEAEWTMGLPWLGLCRLSLGDYDKARFYLDWTDRVRLNGLLPEAYIPVLEEDELTYAPCDHNPLGWPHALALILRKELMERDAEMKRVDSPLSSAMRLVEKS